MFTPWEDPVSGKIARLILSEFLILMLDANKVYFTKKGGLRLLMELAGKNNSFVIRKSACSAIWNFGGSGKIFHRVDHALLTPQLQLEIRLRILLSVGALEFALSLLKEEEEYLQTCGVNIMWYDLNLRFFYM